MVCLQNQTLFAGSYTQCYSGGSGFGAYGVLLHRWVDESRIEHGCKWQGVSVLVIVNSQE